MLERLLLFAAVLGTVLNACAQTEIYFNYDKKADLYEYYVDLADYEVIEIGISTNRLYAAEVFGDDEKLGKMNRKSAILVGEDVYQGNKVGKDRVFWIKTLRKLGFEFVDADKSGGNKTLITNSYTGQQMIANGATYTKLLFIKN